MCIIKKDGSFLFAFVKLEGLVQESLQWTHIVLPAGQNLSLGLSASNSTPVRW